MSLRRLLVLAPVVLVVSCQQTSPLGPESIRASLGRVTVQGEGCLVTCPAGASCAGSLPCVPTYALRTTLTIAELAGERLLVSDVRVSALAPDGAPIGAAYPPLSTPLNGRETKIIEVAVVTTPGPLFAGTMLRATVVSERGEATDEAPVPAI